MNTILIKKILLIACILFSELLFAQQVGKSNQNNEPFERYVNQSQLSHGEYYKISIEKSGVYQLTYKKLVDMGIKNLNNVHIHGYGGALIDEDFSKNYIDDLPEVAVYYHKGRDGIFGPGDYILFYARGVISWSYDSLYQIYNRKRNCYSNHAYYFVSSNGEDPHSIISQKKVIPTNIDTVTTYTAFRLYEKEKINLVEGGRNYYGDSFYAHPNLSFTFNIPHLIKQSINIFFKVASKSREKSSIILRCNHQEICNTPLTGDNEDRDYITARKVNCQASISASNALFLELIYNKPSQNAWLDYLVVNAKCTLTYTPGTLLTFRNDTIKDDYCVYSIDNMTTHIQVWDITDTYKIERMDLHYSGAKATFVDNRKTQHEYIVVDVSKPQFASPKIVGLISNQNLHGLSQTDMVIITVDDFLNEAEAIADLHRNEDAMTVHVVTAQQVYNEFSSATPDASAYRRFMKMFYDRSLKIGKAPRYLLLMGDGCFDNRGLYKDTSKGNIYRLLTYQAKISETESNAFVSDDYFGFLRDTTEHRVSRKLMDIAVGRIPCATKEQAHIMVDKIVNYKHNLNRGYWQNTLMFVADDDSENYLNDTDSIVHIIENKYPGFDIKKIYLDAYQQEYSTIGESYPDAKRSFDETIRKGCSIVHYMGHGSPYNLANEQMIGEEDLQSMHNRFYPLFITATCSFTKYDGMHMSGGERLLFNPSGGAIALISTSRVVYQSSNAELMKSLAHNLFKPYSMGEIFRISKNQYIKNKKILLSYPNNHLEFCFIGDPALSLSIDLTHKVVTDSVNGKSVTSFDLDTMAALDFVEIKGHLEPLYQLHNSTQKALFNGELNLQVYDKKTTIQTLGNNDRHIPLEYDDYLNVLYSGSVTVKNGLFRAQFMVPKDIRYNVGLGKLSYYATDETYHYTANGLFNQICIGGHNEQVDYEYKAPEVELFLNTPRFVSGDIVNDKPTLMATIYDESGINRVGSGIGHDIIVRLDNDSHTEKVLNDYYHSTIDSYKEGQLIYQFETLEDGYHTLYFRVWDLMNNSATKTLDFYVDKGKATQLYSINMYPNPAKNITYLSIKHDRPSLFAEVIISVYDMMGRKVYSVDQDTMTDNSGEFTLEWNLLASNGHKLIPGIYIVNVDMIVENGEHSRQNLKLMVK